MKKLLVFAAAPLLIIACNNAVPKPGEPQVKSASMSTAAEEKEERNKKIAMECIEGINAHNADKAFKDATPDAIDYGDGNIAVAKGIDSIKKALNLWLAAFPDVKGENLKSVADGDWVMVWGTWSGTFKKDFMGMKATGKSYKVPDVDIFKFNDDGKIIEHYSIQSTHEIARQIGMKMPNT